MLQLSIVRAFAVALFAVALAGCHSSDPPPPPPGSTTFTVGGNITGLTQGSVVLRLNGANDLTVSSTASGAVGFTFPGGGLANGASYTVTIATQPNVAAPPVSVVCGPAITNASGTINGANVTNVALACASYTIGGTVSGLKQGSSVELQINALDGKVHTVSANGAFTFPSANAAGIGSAYAIAIKQQPAGQTCLIVDAFGLLTAAAPNATAAQVGCYDNVTDALSGTYQVTHVDGAVFDAVRDFLTFFPDGTFLFGLHEADNPECGPSGNGGLQYGVYNWDDASHDFRVVHLRKFTEPQECGLDETTVGKIVIREDRSLLFADEEGTVTLTPVPSTPGELIGSWGGPQAFTVLFADGTFFSADTRAFGQGSGTFPGIEDGCYTLTGTRASGTYTTNLSASCAVSNVQNAVDTTGPLGLSQWTTTARTFNVTGDTLQIALVPAAPSLLVPVQRILVSPTTPSTFRVSGTITGLAGTTGVTLRLNGQTAPGFNVFRAAGSTSFAFDAPLQSGATYAVGVPVAAQPSNPTQFCRPTAGGAGTIVASDVTNVVITCTDSSGYTVTGTVTGLAGGAQLTLQALYFDATAGAEGDWVTVNASVTANGQYAPVAIPANVGVFMGILAQPAGQSCTLTRASNFSLGPPLTNVNVSCASNVPGGLSGTYTLLDADGRDYVNFNADGTLTTVFIHRDPDPANQEPPADCQLGVPAIDARNGNGVEYGLFNWSPTTGETELLPNPPVDTNGDCGFWDPSEPPSGPWAVLTRVGNTLVLASPPGDPDPFSATATAVESVAGSIVGAWVPEANNGSLLVFHADGTYMYAETQIAGLYPAGLGQERGCYTVSTPDSTITLTIAATCRPDGYAAYDLNLFGGAFVPGTTITTVGPVPFTLVDANTLEYVGRIYKRTAPN